MSIHSVKDYSISRRHVLGLAGVGAAVVIVGDAVLNAPPVAAAPALIYPTPARLVSDNFQAHLARESSRPGTDYDGVTGDPVWSAGAGTVELVDHNNDGGEGRYVVINHGGGWRTYYLHLQSISAWVGQAVNAGTAIGVLGGSGYGSNTYYGDHLHISLRDGSSYVDFELYVNGTGTGGQEEMPVMIESTRQAAFALPSMTWAEQDANSKWVNLPGKAYIPYNDGTAKNFAELAPSKTLFDIVANFYLSNLPAGEYAHFRFVNEARAGGDISGHASATIVGSTSGRVRGQYSVHASLNQGTHRLYLQGYASVPGVQLDLWRANALTW